MNQPEVERGSISHPSQSKKTVEFFRTWEKAVEHVRDHLLTAPECFAWALLEPRIREMVDLEEQSARQEVAAAATATRGVAVQPMVDLYRQAVEEASHEARQMGWHAEDRYTTVAFGIHGVALIIEDNLLVTAYLPGLGEVIQRNPDKLAWSESILPRERGMRPRLDSSRENRRRQQRESSRSEKEKIYYEVFRPAIQHVRKEYHSSVGMDGIERKRDIALLKRVLPPMSQLGFERWISLREQRSPEGASCLK